MYKVLMKIFGIAICIVMIHGYIVNAENKPFTTEIIVRTIENFKNHTDVVKFISIASKNNIAIINLNVKEDEDDAISSGYVFYNSKIAPKVLGYENYDVLKDVINEAHKNGIQVRAWVPQFHDKAAIEKNPNWQMKYIKNKSINNFMGNSGEEYFVNPININVQEYERSILKEIASNYDIDGIVLDWLRFDDLNMDLSDYTRQEYKKSFGYDPININFETDNFKRRQWNEWRTTQIGNYVQKVRSDLNDITEGLFLGVYILPPEFVECGQNATKFKDNIDFVSPMAYFKDWNYDVSWVYNKNSGVLADVKEKISNKEIIPAFDITWTEFEYKKLYDGLRKNYPEISNIVYFAYGRWDENTLKEISKRRMW